MGKNYSVTKPGIADYHRKVGLVDNVELEISKGIQGLGEPLKGLVKGPGDILKATPAYSLAAFIIPVIFLIHFRYRPKLDFAYLKQIKI